MTPGETLKALRLKRKLTQEKLAERAGIDRSWLNQMERGKRPIGPSPAAKLAAVLKVSPEELGAAPERPEYVSLLDRQAALEAAVLRLTGDVTRLTRRVRVLERREPPGSPGEASSAR